ncbi:MAG: hypothetical protein ABMA15_19390 [Vicinamibacterales bacterium]
MSKYWSAASVKSKENPKVPAHIFVKSSADVAIATSANATAVATQKTLVAVASLALGLLAGANVTEGSASPNSEDRAEVVADACEKMPLMKITVTGSGSVPAREGCPVGHGSWATLVPAGANTIAADRIESARVRMFRIAATSARSVAARKIPSRAI